MVQERIDIVVSERGANKAARGVDAIGKSAQSAQGSVQLLRRALGLLGGAVILRELLRLVDGYTNLQNRLRVVTNGTAELGVVTDRLFAIANRTRSAFAGTVEVYARTALATKELGISQQETLNFTESLNHAVILSGANAQEANAAMIQLSQGLASGTLRGDELRSVLEQLPVVADVIAKELGITRGQLREMGMEGKITSDIILRAFRNAREELEERFAKTIPTIGQAFTVLKNSLTALIGGFSTATGASELLARAILFVANNAETFGRVMGALAIIVGVQFGKYAIGAAIRGVYALTAAIAANPLGALVVAITATISFLIAFNDKIKISSDGVATLGDLWAAVVERLMAAWQGLVNFFTPIFNTIRQIAEDTFGDIEWSFRGSMTFMAKGLDIYIGVWRGTFNTIIDIFSNLPTALGGLFELALNGVIKITEDALGFLVEQINEITEFFGAGSIGDVSLGRVDLGFSEGLSGLGEQIKDNFKEGLAGTIVEDFVNGLFDRAEQLGQQRLAKERLEKEERLAAEAGLSRTGENKLDTNVFQEGLQEIQKQFGDTGEFIKDAFVNAFSGAEDALVDFIKTGKLSFKSLIDSMISDLIRLAVRQALLGLIGGLFGAGGGGGSVSKLGGGGVTKFAKGGVVDSPQVFSYGGDKLGVRGEDGKEGIFPLGRDARGRLGVLAVGNERTPRSGDINLNFAIDASGAGEDVERRIEESIARAAPMIVEAAVRLSDNNVDSKFTRRRMN